MREPRRSTPHGETPYSPSSLLRALTANPYDVDALRRHAPTPAEDTPPDNRITRTVTVLLALVLGFTVAVAVTELRRDAAAEDNPRALLEQEVLDARAEIEELEARQETLDGEIADAQAVVLDGADANDAEHLQAEEGLSAASSLEGTGVVLSLQDSVPLPASPGVAEGTVNRVTDGDLQITVNALWAAGAEAISINGQRLSATSAIRTAGSAVLVDFRPLSPPYEVTALGDPQALREGVDAGEGGEYLSDLSSRFGIRASWTTGEELTVPARAIGSLREASAPSTEDTKDSEDSENPENPESSKNSTEPTAGTVPEDEARKDTE